MKPTHEEFPGAVDSGDSVLYKPQSHIPNAQKMTRQQLRADTRKHAWWRWKCFPNAHGVIDQAPRDDRGVIPRRTRRSIALSIARDAFRKARKDLAQSPQP